MPRRWPPGHPFTYHDTNDHQQTVKSASAKTVAEHAMVCRALILA